jgi:hypothetical protein
MISISGIFDPVLGRLNQVDPLADKYGAFSPYVYSFDNPVSFTDPSGDEPNWGLYNREHSALFGGDGSDVRRSYDARGSSSMSLVDFLKDALNSRFGGSWSDGQGHMFQSDEEAFFAGVAYINHFNSWGNTQFGSAAASLVAFGIRQQSGQMPTYDEVQNVLNATKSNLLASTSNTESEDSWYVSAWRKYAESLRETVAFGNTVNPFFGAEAIYFDGGLSFIGHEADKGGFFVLIGSELGQFFTYTEKSRYGTGPDTAAGLEIGRIDVTGNPYLFTSQYVYGTRDKLWLGAGEGPSLGIGYSLGTYNGVEVTAIALQVGFGFLPVSVGWNRGVITPD